MTTLLKKLLTNIEKEYGAKKCIVVEYSDRESFHPLIEYKKPNEHIEDVIDVGLSISSFEHDGLGRYGDPLNPNGDLETMKSISILISSPQLQEDFLKCHINQTLIMKPLVLLSL